MPGPLLPLLLAPHRLVLGVIRPEGSDERLELGIDADDPIVLVGQHVRAKQAVGDVAESLAAEGLEQQGPAGFGRRGLLGPALHHEIQGMVTASTPSTVLMEFVQRRMGEPGDEDEESRHGGDGDGLPIGRHMYSGTGAYGRRRRPWTRTLPTAGRLRGGDWRLWVRVHHFLTVLPTHAHSMCRIYIHVSGRNLLVSFFQHMMCSFLFRSLVPPFRPWMSRVSQGHKHPADRPADLGVGKNT